MCAYSESLGPGRLTTGTYVGLVAGLATATTLAGTELARKILRYVCGLLEHLPVSRADRAFLEGLPSALEQRRYRNSTMRRYVECTVQFLSWCHLAHRPVDSLAVVDFLEHLHRDRGLSTGVRRLHLSALRTVFDRCHGQHLTTGIRYAARPQKMRAATSDEIQHLLQRAGLRERIVVMLCSHLGLRPREIVAMRWSDVDLRKPQVHVARGRRGQTRRFALTPQLVQAFRQYRENRGKRDRTQCVFTRQSTSQPLSVRALQLALNRLGDEAGVQTTMTQLATAAHPPAPSSCGTGESSCVENRNPRAATTPVSLSHASRAPPHRTQVAG